MKTKSVPFFNYSALFEMYREEYTKIFSDVCERGAFILQKDLSEFEENLAQFVGAKFAIGVADGTNAIILGLKSLGIGLGDEVILPSHTYVASAAAVHLCGATPVLADCGNDHLIEPNGLEKHLSSKTKAIMVVQLNGRTADMNPLEKFAKDHGLELVEDSAQAVGSRFKDRSAGTFGSFGTYSFYPAKVLGCFGDGGALVTNNAEIASQVMLLRDHSRDDDGKFVGWGTNCRLDNLQAAFLKFRLSRLQGEIQRRRKIAADYHSAFSSVSALSLPPPPSDDSEHFDVYQNYELEADERDELKQYLARCGVGTLIQFGGEALHQVEVLGLSANLPRTDQVYRRSLMLPLNPSVDDEQVQHVCSSVLDFYKAGT